MNLELAGQIAVVVGGANGMGRMIAKTFAAEGAGVALLDRDPVVDDVAQEAAGPRSGYVFRNRWMSPILRLCRQPQRASNRSWALFAT